MSKPQRVSMIRRSVTLSRTLVEEFTRTAPPEMRGDVDWLVTEALREYVERRRQVGFESAMERMAADPAIRSECNAIDEAFRVAEGDGLEAKR